MKKIIAIVCILLLSACGSKSSTYHCKGEFENAQSKAKMVTTNIVEYEGKQVNKQTITNIVTPTDKAQLDQLQSAAKQIEGQYKDLGLGYTYKVNGSNFEETTTIDYKKVDFKKLTDAGMMQKVDGKYAQVIDLDKTLETLKSNNFTCEKK